MLLLFFVFYVKLLDEVCEIQENDQQIDDIHRLLEVLPASDKDGDHRVKQVEKRSHSIRTHVDNHLRVGLARSHERDGKAADEDDRLDELVVLAVQQHHKHL